MDNFSQKDAVEIVGQYITDFPDETWLDKFPDQQLVSIFNFLSQHDSISTTRSFFIALCQAFEGFGVAALIYELKYDLNIHFIDIHICID